ncbi:hypothetical protein A3D11_02625 [Candidatus Peribacteria bacterium RIFCSPHIGHO2_02_FULL_49_16]|nr:MAG: hypothetical protein A2880_01935 [Candidatus Peribacteria bacterium RIFCSPHIGHO2_01_FULL_49_38]OGJ58490.1 MAG: hypothetical protein A3D11_02625 [Candidatus Peribacteria bacterium RIFCSPHIGHO2_02_FULL_49_16]
MKHLVLVDGHHLMYRAYWAIPRTLSKRDGTQVNAVFGFASIIISLLKQEEPDALLFCFDLGEETFRHKEYVEYKKGRAETPDDFYAQIPLIMECIDAFSFIHTSHKKYEADDLLASYARTGVKGGMRVSIISGDRDVLQLASDTVCIVIPHKGYQQVERLGPDEVKHKFGITPDQVPAWKGLAGDSSDNLPGVRGIGQKTAVKLLQKYGSLEEVYAHLNDLRPTEREKLQNGKEQAFFCQRMARLVDDIPPEHSLDSLSLHHLHAENVLSFFRACEFTLLSKRFQELLKTPFGKSVFSFETSQLQEEHPGQMMLFS